MKNVENSALEDKRGKAEASVPSSVKEGQPAAGVLPHCFLLPQGVRGVLLLKIGLYYH